MWCGGGGGCGGEGVTGTFAALHIINLLANVNCQSIQLMRAYRRMWFCNNITIRTEMAQYSK